MAANTNISWATHTWNPWVGCDKVSPACDHCYAEAWAKRAGSPGLWEGERRRTKTWGDPIKWNRSALARGVRESVFTCSLADFFDNHKALHFWRRDALQVISDCTGLDWYLVTKRIPNVAKMLPLDFSKEQFGHVVIIITVVKQAEFDRDAPRLKALKDRWPWLRVGLSIEPMLGPIDLRNATWLDWVIVGGESGGQARPLHPAWPRAIRDQCAAAGVPFHFKQHGEFLDGVRVGVNKSGRMLDGLVHDAGPKAMAD